MIELEREHLQQVFDDLTSFLLDNVAEDETWEDSFPHIDDIRAQIGELLAEA